LTVYFEKRLRGEQTFADLDELKEAIAQNVAQAKDYFEI
jgi:FAD synthase